MSWQGYIDNLLASGNLISAAIVGHPDGQVWAASPGFDLYPGEIKAISGGFSVDSTLTGTGILANNTKYFLIQADPNQMQGRKGQLGISIAKAGKCMIVGTYGEGQIPGNARKSVEHMIDYLRESGY